MLPRAIQTTAALLLVLLALHVLAALGITTSLWATNLVAYLPRHAGFPIFGTAVLLAGLLFASLRPQKTPALVFAFLGIACLMLPDRSGFVGDFLLRRGSLASGNYGLMFPQSLPLDRLVFGSIVPWAAAFAHLSIPVVCRLVGALAYAGLLLAAARSSSRLDGIPRSHTILLLAGCGLASIFTGFARDTVLFLPLLAAFLLALGSRSDRRELDARVEWLLLALLALHRGTLFLIPAYTWATFAAARSRRDSREKSRTWMVGLGALILGAAILAPTYARILFTFDLGHHLQWLKPSARTAPPFVDPGHFWDVFCAIVLLAPGALLAPLAFVAPAEGVSRRVDGLLLAAWLPLALLTAPQQGIFRDYDVYAAMALTWTWVGVRALSRAATAWPRWAGWTSRFGASASLVGMLAALLVAATPPATVARVEAAVRTQPGQAGPQRAQWLDYLAVMTTDSGNSRRVAGLEGRAAELAPTPLRLVRAGLSFAAANDFARARDMFGTLVALDSQSTLGWSGYAAASAQLADSASAALAMARLMELLRSPARRAVARRFFSQSTILDPTGALQRKLGLEAPDR